MAKRTRKSARKVSRRRRMSRRMRGGWRNLSPASVNDTSMAAPTNMLGKQGQEYNALHAGQHGGAHTPMAGAPAFESQTLPANMVEASRVGGTLHALNEIKGMQDGGDGNANMNADDEEEEEPAMAGGRRRRKNRRGSRKSRKSRRSRRRQGGGAHMQIHPADSSAPGMLLSGRQASGAEAAMNPEWALAKNPAAFAPRV